MQTEKNKFKLIAISAMILSVPLMFLILAWYLGLFAKIQMNVVGEEKTLVAFSEKFGKNFNKVADVVFRTFEKFEQQKLTCKPVAFFHNDEDKVQRSDRFSSGGCLLPEQEVPAALSKPAALFESYLTKFKIEQAAKEKYQIDVFSAAKYLHLVIEAHPAIAYQKALAKMRSYCQKQQIVMKFPIVQLYQGNSTFEYFLKLE